MTPLDKARTFAFVVDNPVDNAVIDAVWEALTTFDDNNPADNADSAVFALVVSAARPVVNDVMDAD